MNRTLQDRLVKALRRAGIAELEAANHFLVEEFLPGFNARFAVPAAEAEDAHRPVAEGVDLDRILAPCEQRVVQNDWTIRWQNRYFQLSPRESGVKPKQRVEVRPQLDGRIRIFAGDRELSWSITRSETSQKKKRANPVTDPRKSSQGQRPAANHPWRGPAA